MFFLFMIVEMGIANRFGLIPDTVNGSSINDTNFW